MAKKAKSDTTYTVLTGCNIRCTDAEPLGVRYEAGDKANDLTADEIKELSEIGVIEVSE